jgi:serine-type D-Ala-D-Ala endopeptidase (penicillin-binding protein 7)
MAAVLCALLAAPVASAREASGSASRQAAGSSAGKSAANKRAAASRTSARQSARTPSRKLRPVAPPRPSMGQKIGLHAADDPLALKSGVALVMDARTNEVLFSKNSEAVLPIASITKLMTAMVVAEAQLPLDERLTVGLIDQLDTGKYSRSRLKPGTQLTRGELMHLSLMASENRAAYALGKNYPGGLKAFVAAMNQKAVELGMKDTRYVEPTGLSSDNRSSASDLSILVKAAMEVPVIRDLSTSPEASFAVGTRQVQFRNTNGLIRDPTWEIGLQKTGFISEAGRCLVMQARLAGRELIMVLLDSAGKYSRMGDAERIRVWLQGVATQATQGVLPGALSVLPAASVVPAIGALTQPR